MGFMHTEPEHTAAMPTVLTVAGLRKSYGTVQAVRDVSFSVQ